MESSTVAQNSFISGSTMSLSMPLGSLFQQVRQQEIPGNVLTSFAAREHTEDNKHILQIRFSVTTTVASTRGHLSLTRCKPISAARKGILIRSIKSINRSSTAFDKVAATLDKKREAASKMNLDLGSRR